MDTKHHYKLSYQWRLFLPVVIVLWVVLIGFSVWQSYRTEKYQRTFVEQQLKLINQRVARAWKNGDEKTLSIFKQFMREFYVNDPLFDEIRMTIFNSEWEAVDTVGTPIHITRAEYELMGPDEMKRRPTLHHSDNPEVKSAYYLGTPIMRNGDEYVVFSTLPKDHYLDEQIVGNTRDVWIIVFSLALIFTLLAYITTRHLAKNIYLLRQFANRMADDNGFVPGYEFTHDELGDIAQKIVKIYNDRAEAREEIEREHKMAIHTLEEKARQKRQMTSNINHELKTPIGVIKGYLDTIVESPDMDENTKEHFINKAREHVNRLANLVTDVSAITRLEEGQNQIGKEQLDFHEIAYVFSNDAHDSGILGHFEVELKIPLGTYVNGNNNLLVGLLMNLTKNAVNYSGGDKIVIECLGEENGFYKFSFRDNGNGVPEASIDHLFDRFYRIDTGRSRKSGGTGLGLAIVFNTIKAHGGTISALNSKNGGLEFIFTLPKWEI